MRYRFFFQSTDSLRSIPRRLSHINMRPVAHSDTTRLQLAWGPFPSYPGRRLVLNSTQSTKNTVIAAVKSCSIQGAVFSAKRSSSARPRCGSVAPRRDYVI